MIQITNEDNMKLMARYEDNYFDLAIVDPPYGLGNKLVDGGAGRNGKFDKNRGSVGWDIVPKKKYFKELFRVSKNQIIWGSNYFDLPPTRCNLIWDKMQEFSGSDFELAWTSFDKASKAFRMSRVEAYSNGKIHPTQKPVKLYEWLLMNYAQRKCDHKHEEHYRHLCTDCRNQDVKILDTHLGSGSIAIACHNLKFDLTACELDKEYFDAAMKRLKQHQQQLTMF